MPAALEIRLLGEVEVWCEGSRIELPKSVKTRALLAYLALSSGPQRRDRLCDLLWDVTDDRRGALRWSLSKLRRIVDDDVPRLDATRTHVELRRDALEVDWLRVRAEAADLEHLAVERLEAPAGMFRGELLEDIAQPDFETFDAWMTAHRADARALRLRLLQHLVARLSATPERALPYARTWLAVDPQDPNAAAAVDRCTALRGARGPSIPSIAASPTLERDGNEPLASTGALALAGFSAAELTTTRWAAILREGEAADLVALAGVSPLDAIAALEHLAQRGFVRLVSGMRGGSFAFEQAAVADAIARTMSPPRRAAMHLEAARYLEGRFTRLHDVDPVIHHLARARDPAETTKACLRLARRCEDLGGLEQSRRLFEQGLAACEGLPARERSTTEITLLAASARTLAVGDAARLAEQLRARGNEALREGLGEAAGAAFLRAAELRWHGGEYDLALRDLREVTLASAETGLGRVRALARVAVLRIALDRDRAAAAAALQEAESHLEGFETDAPFEVPYARGMLLAHEGDLERGRAALEDACRRARMDDPLAELEVTEALLRVTLQGGDRTAATALAREVERLAPRCREGGEGLRAWGVCGLLDAEIDTAQQTVLEALEGLQRLVDKRREAWLCNRWGLRMAASGRWEATLAFAERARDAARHVPLPTEQVIADALTLAATTLAGSRTTRRGDHARAALGDPATVSAEARAIARWAVNVAERGTSDPRDLASAAPWLP